ncbi:MAG: hypothetical protein AAF386_07785 [Pseudomonadota bacterium]
MSAKMLTWAALAATVLFGVAAYVIVPFTGYTADVLPIAQPKPAIQPAGYAFSIWGVIYLWLVASAVFGIIRKAQDTAWAAALIWLIPSLVIGAFWNWIANQSAIWATVAIWIMLALALRAAFLAPLADRWWLKAPVALYAGWLSAASFVSLGVTLPGYGIGFDANTWAVIGICVATILAVTVQIRLGAMPTYGAAIIWAFVGILINNTTDIAPVTWVANAGIFAVVVAIILAFRRRA